MLRVGNGAHHAARPNPWTRTPQTVSSPPVSASCAWGMLKSHVFRHQGAPTGLCCVRRVGAALVGGQGSSNDPKQEAERSSEHAQGREEPQVPVRIVRICMNPYVSVRICTYRNTYRYGRFYLARIVRI